MVIVRYSCVFKILYDILTKKGLKDLKIYKI